MAQVTAHSPEVVTRFTIEVNAEEMGYVAACLGRAYGTADSNLFAQLFDQIEEHQNVKEAYKKMYANLTFSPKGI